MYFIGRMSRRLRAVLIGAAVIFVLLVIIDVTGFGRGVVSVSVELKEDTDVARCEFLAGYGWEVTPLPEEVSELVIPGEFNEVYEQYNDLQLSQGFDLRPYRGKTVKRYAYTINNYPQQVNGVRANLLIYDGKVIGGDVCTLALDGFMHGFEPEDVGTTNASFYEAVNL